MLYLNVVNDLVLKFIVFWLGFLFLGFNIVLNLFKERKLVVMKLLCVIGSFEKLVFVIGSFGLILLIFCLLDFFF